MSPLACIKLNKDKNSLQAIAPFKLTYSHDRQSRAENSHLNLLHYHHMRGLKTSPSPHCTVSSVLHQHGLIVIFWNLSFSMAMKFFVDLAICRFRDNLESILVAVGYPYCPCQLDMPASMKHYCIPHYFQRLFSMFFCSFFDTLMDVFSIKYTNQLLILCGEFFLNWIIDLCRSICSPQTYHIIRIASSFFYFFPHSTLYFLSITQ